MTDVTKRKAHFQAFGYEPLRMKPAHFASGFFIALTGQVYLNEILNKVAVIKANKGLREGYKAENVLKMLQDDLLVAQKMTQADVELLRTQVNSVVNNDSAMFPAFRPYGPKGNDYTFISPHVLTTANRTDGYAGHFVLSILDETNSGKAVLETGLALASETEGVLEQFIKPLLKNEESVTRDLKEDYECNFGVLDQARIVEIVTHMQKETEALQRLCANMEYYSHYKKIRCYVIGLLAWLMSYLVKTASSKANDTPLLFFDFMGQKGGRTRSQSQACYARLREIVRRSYTDFAVSGRFDFDPIEEGLFNRKNRPEETDFSFLETHFGDLALRMGYAQPRASRVKEKHFELQPDTLRVLMLSILDNHAKRAIPLEKVCDQLRSTWGIVIGACDSDLEDLQSQGYFGIDEEDLRHNSTAFSRHLISLNMAFEPSDGLVLCSTDIGEVL